MLRILEQRGRWLWSAIGLAAIALFTLFALGVARENRMLRDLAEVRASAAERIADQQHHMNAWITAEAQEGDLWTSIAAEYAEQVTSEQVRMMVPYALAALAEQCGIAGLSLTELEGEVLDASVLDEFGGSWRPLRESAPERTESDGASGEDEIIDFGYRLLFRSDYRALGLFLDGLGRMPGMLSVHSVVIRRGRPRAEVDLILVAQGRRT